MKRIRTERHRTGLRALVAIAAALVVAVAAPAAAAGRFGGGSYGWPVRPFDSQHPVRGFFGDPRIGETPYGVSRTLHFGIDVCAPNGTPVYATLTGRVVIESVRPQTVVVSGSGVAFAYWHITPSVANGAWATAYRTVLGRVAAPWEHVHFAELRAGRYLNPLRPGALGPYRDWTRPAVDGLSFERDGTPTGRRNLAGGVDLVAEVSDRTPLRAPGRWADKPVMPAVVRWRLTGRFGGTVVAWRTAVDLRGVLPSCSFDTVYAAWTRQNHPWRVGRYRVVLAHRFELSALRPGGYRLEVAAADTRGNRATGAAVFTVAASR